MKSRPKDLAVIGAINQEVRLYPTFVFSVYVSNFTLMISYPIDFMFEGTVYEAMVSMIKTDGLQIFHVYNISPSLPLADEPFTCVLNKKNEMTWCAKNKFQVKFAEVVSKELKPFYSERSIQMAS